jgi:hypothetical protein
MGSEWRHEYRTGRELVEDWVDEQESIAEAARILGLGNSGRQRLWAFLRTGAGLGDFDELRTALILDIPFRAVVMADTPVRQLFDPGLSKRNRTFIPRSH